MMTLKDFKNEILRAYRVLGKREGYWQNETDIIGWKNEGLINTKEFIILRGFNTAIQAGEISF